jgi:hypothetical protein
LGTKKKRTAVIHRDVSTKTVSALPVVKAVIGPRQLQDLVANGKAQCVLSSDIRRNIAGVLVDDPIIGVDAEIPLLTNTETTKVIY